MRRTRIEKDLLKYIRSIWRELHEESTTSCGCEVVTNQPAASEEPCRLAAAAAKLAVNQGTAIFCNHKTFPPSGLCSGGPFFEMINMLISVGMSQTTTSRTTGDSQPCQMPK